MKVDISRALISNVFTILHTHLFTGQSHCTIISSVVIYFNAQTCISGLAQSKLIVMQNNYLKYKKLLKSNLPNWPKLKQPKASQSSQNI
jgi:hypothetical protein